MASKILEGVDEEKKEEEERNKKVLVAYIVIYRHLEGSEETPFKPTFYYPGNT